MDFQILLDGSAKEHGHLCPGQVIGVRMAMLGLDLIGLENPKREPLSCLRRDRLLPDDQPGDTLKKDAWFPIHNGLFCI